MRAEDGASKFVFIGDGRPEAGRRNFGCEMADNSHRTAREDPDKVRDRLSPHQSGGGAAAPPYHGRFWGATAG